MAAAGFFRFNKERSLNILQSIRDLIPSIMFSVYVVNTSSISMLI